jgi:lipopolysaccharide export system protein LptC
MAYTEHNWEVASEQALADAERKLASLLDHLAKDLTKSKD